MEVTWGQANTASGTNEGAATAAQPLRGSSGRERSSGDTHTGQRAKWVRLMMLLRLRERPQLLGGLQVLTRKGIDAMCKAYKKRRKKR